MKYKVEISLNLSLENNCHAPSKEEAYQMAAEYVESVAFRSNKLIELENLGGAVIHSSIKIIEDKE